MSTRINEETIIAIEKAKERIKKGKFLTEEQAKRRLNLHFFQN